MLTPGFFKNLPPQSVGKYNHYNDRFMAATVTSAYQPPTPTMAKEIPSPKAPSIIIINNRQSDIWYHLYWRSMIDSLFSRHSHHPRHVTVTTAPSQGQSQNQKKQNEAGILAALMFFVVLFFGATVALAYGMVESKKIAENLLASRKRLTNGIKLFWSAFLGFAGTLIGVQLGTYYGPALFGATLGATLSGILSGLIAISAGIFLGKYAAKVFTYIATGFKTTNSDPYSLRPSVAKMIDKQFSAPLHQISRPNLMLGYILNKIAIAKQNKANPNWIKTLEGYRQDLKEGKYSEALKHYFDCEWAMVRNDWYLGISIPADQRFTNSVHLDIEHDFKALSIITSNVITFQHDKDFAQPQNQYIPPPQNSPVPPSVATISSSMQHPPQFPSYYSPMTNAMPFNASPIPTPQQPSPTSLYPNPHEGTPSAPPPDDLINQPRPTYFPSGGHTQVNNGFPQPQYGANNNAPNQNDNPFPVPYYRYS